MSFTIKDGKLSLVEAFYKRLDARLKAINDAGLLAVPILVWAHKKGDAGKELTDEQLIDLCKLQVERYSKAHVLWILAGDNQYTTDADRWKKIGRAVFGDRHPNPVTTHPTGETYPWAKWEDEKWLTVLGYQSGHGDSDKSLKWLTQGPVAEYGQRKEFTRPILNLEPPYEGHNGYSTKKPHSESRVRRATYWSLLSAPVAGITYGGHGIWSWHTKPGEEPTDHKGTGVAKVWSDALDLPAAGQMKHVRDFFESVKWTELRPDPNLLSEQPGARDSTKFIAAAATTDGKTLVFYTPIGGTIPVKPFLQNREAAMEWFNPRTGEKSAGDDKYKTPDAQDWVLVIRK